MAQYWPYDIGIEALEPKVVLVFACDVLFASEPILTLLSPICIMDLCLGHKISVTTRAHGIEKYPKL
jgi:hypothetical protein